MSGLLVMCLIEGFEKGAGGGRERDEQLSII